MLSAREHLEATRELIDKPEKWIKHRLEENDSYCIVGALYSANQKLREKFQADLFNKCIDALQQQCGDIDLVDFNNHPDTTHQDVMDLFDRTIKYVIEN